MTAACNVANATYVSLLFVNLEILEVYGDFTYHFIVPSNDQAIEEREMLIVFKIPTVRLYSPSFQQRV